MATSDPHILYNRYSDNLALGATITLDSCTAEAGYSTSRLNVVNAARPLRLVETSGAIVFDMLSPVEVAVAALFHCNFEENLDVRLQANTSNSWGSPPFEYTFDIGPWRTGRFPPQPWDVFENMSGWGAFQYWRLLMGTNAVALTIGHVWLGGVVRRLNPDFISGRSPRIDSPVVQHQTAYRKLRTPLGTVLRSVAGTLPPTDDTVIQDVLDWMVDANGRPFLFVPDGTVNEAWLAIHTTTAQEVQDILDHDASFASMSIEEDGRGLEPTPSPLP